MRVPASSGKYIWTQHVFEKMKQYGLSESRLKRIIRFPSRIEEGIAPQTIAVMQPAGTKKYQEIWVMYRFLDNPSQQKKKNIITQLMGRRIKIITAWRYPGQSPARDPVPAAVLAEIHHLL